VIVTVYKHIALSLFLLLASYGSGQDLSPVIQIGHSDDVTTFAFIDDGKAILSGGMDKSIVEWDIQSQTQTAAIFGHNGGISCLAFNDVNSILAVGTYDNQVYIYDFKDSGYVEPTIYEFDQYITSVAINDQGTKVVVASADFSVNVIEGKELKQLYTEGDVIGAWFSHDNTHVYFGNYSGAIYKLNTEADKLENGLEKIHQTKDHISEIALSPKENYLAYGTAGVNGNGGELSVLNLKNNKVIDQVFEFVPYLGFQLNSISFLDEKSFLFKNQESKIERRFFTKKKSLLLLDQRIETGFVISPDQEWLATGFEDELRLVNLENTKETLKCSGTAENPIRFAGINQNTLLVEYPSGIKKWDLESLSTELIKDKLYDTDWQHYTYSGDLKWEGDHYHVGDLTNNGEWIYMSLKNSSHARFGAFSNDKKYYSYFTEDGHLYNVEIQDTFTDWSGQDEDKINVWSYDEQYAALNVNGLVMHPTQNKVAVLHDNIHVYDLEKDESRKIAYNIRNVDHSLPASFDPIQNNLLVGGSVTKYDTVPYENHPDYDGWWSKLVNYAGATKTVYENKYNGFIALFEMDSLEWITTLTRSEDVARDAELTAMHYDRSQQLFYCGYSDGSITTLLTSDTGYYWIKSTRMTSSIQDIVTSDGGRLVFIINKYGAIGVMDNSFDYIASLVSTKDHEFLAVSEKGYYKRSKNAQASIAFTQGENIYKINQVDDILNRPHEVYREFGIVNAERLAIIESLAATKSGTTSLQFNGPDLKVSNRDKLPLTTTDGIIKIQTDATKTESDLSHMKVWLNGVPVFKNHPSATSKSKWTSKWELPLKRGKNTIRFVCYDEQGAGSTEEIISITCTKPYQRPNLYIGLIGVSEYKDTTKNLRYTVKDGQDFTNVFVHENGKKRIGFPSRFGKVYVDSFYNEDATKEQIREWGEKLKKTNPEDYVILYVSGHGLLDTSFSFFFATHDVDFDHPNARGMSFDELEDLIVGIPAQQKLFLMDACHSGEVIEDRIVIDDAFEFSDGSKGELTGYKYKGTITEDADGETVNQEELKQELFSNYNSRSGATVISATSGSSVALEGNEWSNGVFTYTVINGLINRLADTNDDGEVSVVELSRYVTKMVKEETNGMQVPNDRQENIENNFRIW
jgi:WD40 repeat protein